MYRRGTRTLWALTEDLAKGGMFLRSAYPPEPGEELEIWLGGMEGTVSVALKGRVVHRRERDKGVIPGDESPMPAGAGICFDQVPSGLGDGLDALLSATGFEGRGRGDRGRPGQEAERDQIWPWEEGLESFSSLTDPVEVRRFFEDLCRRIHPLWIRRHRGSLVYTTFLRRVSGQPPSLRVEVEPVSLQGLDLGPSRAVPFVGTCRVRDRCYFFGFLQRPEVMARDWILPLPLRIVSAPDRRTPRYGPELRHPLTAEFPAPDDSNVYRVKNVVDIGFGGLAFKNYPGEELYVPGQALRGVRICDFDRVCYETRAVVRHVTLVCPADGEIFQKVGVEFANHGESGLDDIPCVKQGEMEQIVSPSGILQHLKRVASGKVRILTGLDRSVLFSDGRLRAESRNGVIELTVTSQSLSEDPESDFLDARLRYHYLFRGSYHFFSARTRKQDGHLALEVPDVIHRARRRRVVRVRPRGVVRVHFRFVHPVLGRRMTLPVRDLSIRGLSFEADYTRDLFWKGFRLRSCEIVLETEAYPVGSVEVRSLVRQVSSKGDCDDRCGVEFLDLPAETERQISAYILRRNNPKIRVPTAERIEDLWRLFHRSGFIYPGKMAYIRKLKPEIDETWRRLLSGEMPFYKHIVFREGKEELGTASAVQVYENTWMLQHLAASGHPTKLVPKYVMLGLAQFLMENREIKYLITYFRKENSFPRKIYSGFLRRYPLEEQLRFTRHSFLTLDLADWEGTGRMGGRIKVEGATDEDREVIESYFKKRLHPLLIRSRSLSREALHLPDTSALYYSKGLRRERMCLVAKEGGRQIAFALVENASPGINLSGLLNTFDIHTIVPDEPKAGEARKCLIKAVIDAYRSWQARVAICLTSEQDLWDYLEAGFRKEKEYVCLTWSRRTIKNYYDYVQERFSRFEERKTKTWGSSVSF